MTSPQLFALFALIAPAYCVLLYEWVRTKTWGKGINRAILSVTVAVVSLYAVAFVGVVSFESVPPFKWALLPQQVWRLFLFSLWFGLTSRQLVRSRAEMDPATHSVNHQRHARLTTRADERPARAAWRFVWGIWVYAAVATVCRPLLGPIPMSELPWAGVSCLLCFSLLLSVFGPSAIRAVYEEPEPLDRHSNPRLADAYAAHRHIKSVGFYWMTLALVSWSSTMSVLAMWSADARSYLQIAGEISAYLIAIACVAFGIQLSRGREMIRLDVRESNRENLIDVVSESV